MSSKIIDKKTLEYLAVLARIEISAEKEEKLLKNIQEILDYFEQLKEVETSSIEPLSGGTSLSNILIEDDYELRGQKTERQNLIESFPEKENGFLKIPPVFE